MNGGENEPATRGELRVVRGNITLMQGDITALKGDVRTLKDDVSAMRSDITGIRGDMTLMRDDIVTSLRHEIREMLRPITITLAHHTAELADIRGHIKDKMVTRDEFHARMDGFTGRVDDSDYSSANKSERLNDHAKRISALEEKLS